MLRALKSMLIIFRYSLATMMFKHYIWKAWRFLAAKCCLKYFIVLSGHWSVFFFCISMEIDCRCWLSRKLRELYSEICLICFPEFDNICLLYSQNGGVCFLPFSLLLFWAYLSYLSFNSELMSCTSIIFMVKLSFIDIPFLWEIYLYGSLWSPNKA